MRASKQISNYKKTNTYKINSLFKSKSKENMIFTFKILYSKLNNNGIMVKNMNLVK